MNIDNVRIRVIRSDRRTVGLQVSGPGEVIVRAPKRMTDTQIRQLITEKADWIRKALTRAVQSEAQRHSIPALTNQELSALTAEARALIPSRVHDHATRMGISYGRISLRKQKTRWGSCSAQGNLNFNILLLLAPREVLDSVIIHELCHRRHMNHSKAFWNEVYRWCPDYDTHKQWLKKNGPDLLARLG